MEKAAPTLIIGVGGIGAEITALLEQRCGSDAQGKNQKFLIIDTDINAIRERRSKGYQGEVLRMSENITVGKCLHQMPEVADWYPKMNFYNYKSMSEGAGQVRAISRLAFESALKQGKVEKVLNKIIEELHNLSGQEEEQQQRILIISTLAGGTGSGAILPLALYLRHYMKKNYPLSEVNIKGFFLMPDVLDSVVGGYRERLSIYANAYAAIKELTAFMRKADHLADNSGELYMKLPGEGLSQWEDQDGSSYNYCFLIGKRNESDWNLASFEEYKGLIADGIYMQAMSPVQDIINSREDNLMKSLLVQMMEQPEKGLPHFGGMGTCKMQYPYQLLKLYLSCAWALDAMEDGWAKYDREFQKYRVEMNNKKGRGEMAGQKTREQFIKEKIDIQKNIDADADAIYTCFRHKDPKKEDVVYTDWVEYLKAMKIYMEELFKKNDEITLIHKIEVDQKDAAGKWFGGKTEVREAASKDLKEYAQCLEDIREQLREKIRDMIWSVEFLDNKQKYHLGGWLYQNGVFLKPNAVRYFLIMLQNQVTTEKNSITEKDLKTVGQSVVQSVQDDGTDDYKGCITTLQNEAKEVIWRDLLCELERFLQSANDSYAKFFEQYAGLLISIEKQSQETVKKLDIRNGKTDLLVCCDQKRRTAMLEEMKQYSNYINAKNSVSEFIYQKLFGALCGAEEPAWEEDMLRFWQNQFEMYFGDLFNFDIMEALGRDAKTKGRNTEQYIEQMILLARQNQAKPFLRLANTLNKHRIYSCCYHKDLDRYDDSMRDLIQENLTHYNGRSADEPDKYEILFYQSFFGVSADELIELLHIRGQDIPFVDGAYFDAYQYMMDHLILDDELLPVLTPHIDKHWHLMNVMGDIDPEYQKRWLCRKYDCFVALLSSKLIRGDAAGVPHTLDIRIQNKAERHSFAKLKDAFQMICKRKELEVEIWKHFERGMTTIVKTEEETGDTYENTLFFRTALEVKVFERIIGCLVELPDANYDRDMLNHMLEAFGRVCGTCAGSYMADGSAAKGIQVLWNHYKEANSKSELIKKVSAAGEMPAADRIYEDFVSQMEDMGVSL